MGPCLVGLGPIGRCHDGCKAFLSVRPMTTEGRGSGTGVGGSAAGRGKPARQRHHPVASAGTGGLSQASPQTCTMCPGETSRYRRSGAM